MPSGPIALGGGSILSGIMGSNAAGKAADAQAAAADKATALQKEMYYDQKATIQPWVNVGEDAVAAQAYEMGIGPKPTYGGGSDLTIEEIPGTFGFASSGAPGASAPTTISPLGQSLGITSPRSNFGISGTDRALRNPGAFTQSTPAQYKVGDRTFSTREAAQAYIDSQGGGTEYGGFKASPGYDFVKEQGELGLERKQTAQGMRLGGPALKEAMRYNSGLASQEYGNFYNRLAGLSGTGQTGVSQLGGIGMNYANQAGSNMMAAGDAAASGYMGKNNAWQGTLNNLSDVYMAGQYGAFGGGSGFGGGGGGLGSFTPGLSYANGGLGPWY